jgi:hypothetical protein
MIRARVVIANLAATLALGAAGEAHADADTHDATTRAHDESRPTIAPSRTAAITPHAQWRRDDSTMTPPRMGGTTTDNDGGTAAPSKSFATSAWGTAAALVPGIVAHGTGHLVIGDTKTGLRLLSRARGSACSRRASSLSSLPAPRAV